MNYPKLPDLKKLADEIELQAQLKAEYGSKGIAPALKKSEKELQRVLERLKKLPVNRALAKREPDALKQILALRPAGARRQDLVKRFAKQAVLIHQKG